MLMRGFEESNRTLKIQLKGLHYECAFLMAFFKEGEVDFAELVFSFFCLGWAERLFKTLNFQKEASFENVFSKKRLFFLFIIKKSVL